jgi:hypothetical protein
MPKTRPMIPRRVIDGFVEDNSEIQILDHQDIPEEELHEFFKLQII